MVERVEKLTPKKKWWRAYRDIIDFEQTLADDGALIIKFFLHISKKEQKKRFHKLLKDPLEAWHVSPEDWEHHHDYEKWAKAYEEAFERTDTEWGPWTIIPATDRRYTRLKVYHTVLTALEERLDIPDKLPEVFENLLQEAGQPETIATTEILSSDELVSDVNDDEPDQSNSQAQESGAGA